MEKQQKKDSTQWDKQNPSLSFTDYYDLVSQ